MAENSDQNPHIIDGPTPLNDLMMSALRRYGDFHPGTASADVKLMLLEFANLVIDDIRAHPYFSDELDYYKSPTETRAVPDRIIIAGLLMHYAAQQISDKFSLYSTNYYKVLNGALWDLLAGNSKIRFRVVDDGSSPKNVTGTTDTVTGLVNE